MSTVRPLIKYKVSCGSSPNIQTISLDDNDTLDTVDEKSMVVSYNKGFNEIKVEYFSENVSLNRFEVRVTNEAEEYGLGIGKLAYEIYGSISGSAWHIATVDINAEYFPKPGKYRLSLYARSAVDGTWSYKYLVFDLNNLPLTTTDTHELIYALVDRDIQ